MTAKHEITQWRRWICFLKNNAKDIINTQSIAKMSANYKPIKVFSSCVIANADGTNTIQDKPVNYSVNQSNIPGSNTISLSPSNLTDNIAKILIICANNFRPNSL